MKLTFNIKQADLVDTILKEHSSYLIARDYHDLCDTLAKYFAFGELLTLEFDSDNKTLTALPKAR